jgi:hypothetical protein
VQGAVLVFGQDFKLEAVIGFHTCWPSVHSAARDRVQGNAVGFHTCWLEAYMCVIQWHAFRVVLSLTVVTINLATILKVHNLRGD